jgi:ProP effector
MEFTTMDYREYIASAQAVINRLSELYLHCFVAEPWIPHRPIALGIGNQLIEAGVITIAETRGLAVYTKRLAYLRSMVPGAPRIGLDGQPAGEVTEEHAKCAKASLDAQLKKRNEAAAREKAKCTAAAEQKRAARNGSGPVRDAASSDAYIGASPDAIIGAACAVEPVKPVKPDGVKRLSLSDLRAAALARKAAQAVA